MLTEDSRIFIQNYYGFIHGTEYSGYKLADLSLIGEERDGASIKYTFRLTYMKTKHIQISLEDFYDDHLTFKRHHITLNDGNIYELSLFRDGIEDNHDTVSIILIGFVKPYIHGLEKPRSHESEAVYFQDMIENLPKNEKYNRKR